MKKTILVMMVLFLTTGCTKVGTDPRGIEKEVIPVVKEYLDNSAAGNWQDVFQILTGEALAEARANAGRVSKKGKMVSKKLKLTTRGKDVALVSADFTKNAGEDFDRVAYDFRLIKIDEQWLIYKSTYGQYQHDMLSQDKPSDETMLKIKEYIELPFQQKRNLGGKYLAGRLLQDSLRSATLPVDDNTIKEQEKITTKVKNMQGLGVAKGYALIKVDYEVVRNEVKHPMQAIVEAIEVNGDWKISGIDLSQT